MFYANSQANKWIRVQPLFSSSKCCSKIKVQLLTLYSDWIK